MRYSEIARIRIEHRLIASVSDGRYDPKNDRIISGHLGTWSTGLAPFFTLKDELAIAIEAKLQSKDAMGRAYALKMFSSILPVLQPIPYPWTIATLQQGLSDGDA